MRKVNIYESHTNLSSQDSQYHELVKLTSLSTGCRFASLSLNSKKGFLLKSIHGFDFDKRSYIYPFWNYFSDYDSDILVINDSTKLVLFNQNLNGNDIPKIHFYAACPLINKKGELEGILSVFDSKKIPFGKEKKETFRIVANQISNLINSSKSEDNLIKTQLELNSTRNQLIEKEKYYKSLIDNAGDIIYELNSQNKLLYVNQLFEKVTGYSQFEAFNLNVWHLIDKPYRQKISRFYTKQFLKRKSITYFEFPIISKSGKRLWLGQKVKMEFVNGVLLKTIIVARDISEQKELSKKQDKYKNGLRLINYIASNTQYSVDEQLELALEVGRSYLGLDLGAIGQVNKNKFQVKYTRKDGASESIEVKENYELDSVFSSIAYKNDDVLAITDIGNSDLNTFNCYINNNIQTYIGVPYHIKGKKFGTVSFISKKKRLQAFDENEIDFLKLFAKWVGFTLERDNSKQSLLSEQGMMRAFATFSPAAVAMLDNNMRYMAVTKKWREVKGLVGKSIVGKSHYEVQTDIKPEWVPLHQKALNGESIKVESDSYLDTEGRERFIKWEVHPWFTSENIVGGIILFVDDITVIKTKEIELKKAKIAAEKASDAKDQFLSTMSHEIRTPLNAVIGASHLLIHESPRKDQLENLHLLKNSGEHLLALVNDILDFNKIEEGKLLLESTYFNLDLLIKNVITSLNYHADDKNIKLISHLPNEPYHILLGDPTRISQVLINLISNAIKFTNKGKVELIISKNSVSSKECNLRFEVKDTGIGISKDKIKDIFSTFTQADTDTTRKYGGSGLGLAISKKLLELMGSSGIQVESSPGKGSNFYFDLNFKKGSYIDIDTPYSLNKIIVDKGVTKKVLLVEDNEVNRILAVKFLNKWGLKVTCAVNGLECIEMIDTEKFDLILMDLQMPEMDGYQTTDNLRKSNNPYHQNIPIIALTADALVEAQKKVKEVGMNDFVTKPFNPKEFREKMERHLHVTLSE